MKLSANDWPRHTGLDVYLDGKEVGFVVEVDDEAGYVDVLVTEGDPPRAIQDKGRPVIKRLTGTVDVRWRFCLECRVPLPEDREARWSNAWLRRAYCSKKCGGKGAVREGAKEGGRVEVCSTSTVLMVVANLPVLETKLVCRRCGRTIQRDEVAWHSGVELSCGWVCCTCVPAVNGLPAPGFVLKSDPRFIGKVPERVDVPYVKVDPNSPINLCKELDAIQSDKLAALGVPAAFLDPHAANAAETMRAKAACGHCGSDALAEPGSKCLLCGARLCVVCRTRPTASHECPAQRAPYKMEELRDRLTDAIKRLFPDRIPVGTVFDPVDLVVKILEDARQNRAAKDLYDHAIAAYERAAKRYGRAMKTRRFRLEPVPSNVHGFPALVADLGDQGPFYVVAVRGGGKDAAEATEKVADAVRRAGPGLSRQVMVVALPPGAELTVSELVAVDPLPYDAVRRFPGIVETLTCGRCGLTADQNWKGWWTVARDGCAHLCAHCYAIERPDEYVRMKELLEPDGRPRKRGQD